MKVISKFICDNSLASQLKDMADLQYLQIFLCTWHQFLQYGKQLWPIVCQENRLHIYNIQPKYNSPAGSRQISFQYSILFTSLPNQMLPGSPQVKYKWNNQNCCCCPASGIQWDNASKFSVQLSQVYVFLEFC